MFKRLLVLMVAVMTIGTTYASDRQVEQSDTTAKQKRSAKYDRGLNMPSYPFIKKGVWNTGLKASYSQYSLDNYDFLIIDAIGAGGYSFDGSVHLGYFFRDNMMLGARFGYNRNNIDLSNASINVSDIELGLSDASNLKHTYTGTLFYRYYMGLGRGQRFAFFTEVQLGLGGSQAKQYLSADNGLYEKSFNVSLGITPGVMAFITNNLALEVSVDLIGLKYKNVEQISNQLTTGSRSTSSLNCKISLLSLGLGLSFYL